MCAWDLADEFECDRTDRSVAAALPDGATVLTIGWPAVAGNALMRRGDARVLCADSRHEASGFLQLLERVEVECEPVPAESLARAAAACDVVLVEALAGVGGSGARSGRLARPRGGRALGGRPGVVRRRAWDDGCRRSTST